MLRYADQKRPNDIECHYTPPLLARRLVKLVPIGKADCVLDPAAGRTKVFLHAFRTRKRVYCEIDEGRDFLAEPIAYDWAVTNPPYHLLWAFIDKASQEARKGFAYLVNINGLNTLTPRRLALLSERGFHMRHLHVCQVKHWFGRYYFYVFEKRPGPCAVSWDDVSWS